MRDQRASKRRRVSVMDEEGDTEMQDGNDIYSVPSSPSVKDEQDTRQGHPTVEQPDQSTPSRISRRRPSRATQKPIQDDNEDEGRAGTGTPTRAGTRSSGRQRKPVQRFEQGLTQTPLSTRKNGTRTPRSTRKSRQEPEEDEEEEEEENEEDKSPQPHPRANSLARTRSKRASVKSNMEKDEEKETTNSASPEEDQDGLDDLVAMQLQHNLNQPEIDGRDNVATRPEPLPVYAEELVQTLSQRDGFQNELRLLTRVVLEKLNGKRRVPLKGLENEYDKIHQLVEQTVTAGEGNSMLVLGSRGSGKTTILETALSSLAQEHANDFHVVRLNGFLHTDDRLALREMWRQLGQEMNTEEEAGKVSSYADTMATLLALLSHPEELFGPSDGQSNGAVTAARSIVIIMDEFDLFVSHPRQTLLYNLFDIAQARKAPVAVIGLTTKVDITEMLEKRVKSRFSHRHVFVPLPRSFETFSEICFAGLDLEDDEVPEVKSEDWLVLLKSWRTYLQGLWDDVTFRSHLLRIYNQTKSVKEFFTSSLLAISELHHSTYYTQNQNTPDDLSSAIPTPRAFTDQTLTCPDPVPLPFHPSTTVSASPSSLPLSLLLAATRLTALYDPSNEATAPLQSLAPLALSFPAAYAEYVRLLTSAKTSASVSGASATPGRVWGRDVAREAWEKLITWGLVNPVGGGNGTADGRMFRVEVSFEEVVEMAGSGGTLGRWWRDG